MAGSQDFGTDPRNATVKVSVNGDLVPRDEARVSALDAGLVLGDGVWEGVRLHEGRLVFPDEHLAACSTAPAPSRSTSAAAARNGRTRCTRRSPPTA